MLIFLTLFGVSIAFYFGYNPTKQQETILTILTVINIVLVSIAWFFTSEKYLNRDIKKVLEKPAIKAEEKVIGKVRPISEKDVENDDEDIEIIESLLKEKMQTFKEAQSKEYAYEDQIALRRGDVFRTFETTENRIQKEISNLSRRSNINLGIGGAIAIFGIVGLIVFIFSTSKDVEPLEIIPLVVHWLVRLSLVTMVEVFAFFFLKMYKSELTSIQYFQDELTSIESRKIALLFSVLQDSEESTCKSIACLLEIDRNFKMDANQTTAELEKLKMEYGFIRSQINSILDIFKGVLSFKITDKDKQQ